MPVPSAITVGPGVYGDGQSPNQRGGRLGDTIISELQFEVTGLKMIVKDLKREVAESDAERLSSQNTLEAILDEARRLYVPPVNRPYRRMPRL